MAIPNNIIINWSGSIAEIPEGWFLCDGQNGTPNLLNRFVVGAGTTYGLDATGGNKDAQLVEHTHSVSYNTAPNHTHSVEHATSSHTAAAFRDRQHTFNGGKLSSSGSHTHSVTPSTQGESATNKNMPPYYALAFIMYGGE